MTAAGRPPASTRAPDGRWFVVETTRRRVPGRGAGRRGRRGRAAHAAGRRHGARPALRRRPTRARPTPGSASSSSASRTPGSSSRTGLLPWARQLVLASPSPTQLSVDTRSLVGVRARYVQPYEDHVLGGGRRRSSTPRIDRIEPVDGRRRRPCGPPPADATARRRASDRGRRGHLGDRVRLPAAGPARSRRDDLRGSRLPTQTPWWESATRARASSSPGTIGQGAKGLQRHGMPSNSGAVQGARYNARLLAGRIAATRFGLELPRPSLRPGRLVDFVATRADRSARAVAPARLPGTGSDRRIRHAGPWTTASSRWPRPGRRRPGRAGDDPRGGRHRRDLPGAVHAGRRCDRGAGARARSAAALRRRRGTRRAIADIVRKVVPSAAG